jgi:hypothetical protein
MRNPTTADLKTEIQNFIPLINLAAFLYSNRAET